MEDFLLTPKGVTEQGAKEQPALDTKYLNQTYIPYDYWYTVFLESDYHVDFENIPEEITDILNVCSSNQPGMKME